MSARARPSRTLIKRVRLPAPSEPIEYGGVPEWPKGTDCKSAAFRFDGSNPSSPTMKDQSGWIGLFCISVAITGFERQLLATVRWTAATAVASPQRSESVPSFFAQTAAGKTPTAVSIKIPFAASPYPFPEPLPSGGPGRPSGGRILSNCRGALPRRLRRFLGPGSRPGPQRGRRSP